SSAEPAAARDERLKSTPFVVRLMRRPELGAVMGLLIVVVFFMAVANATMFEFSGVMNFLAPAAQLGILAIGASLLMVGGEFDLSVGSMAAFTGLIFAACVVTIGLPLPAAILLTLAIAAAMELLIGQSVIHTGLPSFIVTLASLFILRGLSLVGLKW